MITFTFPKKLRLLTPSSFAYVLELPKRAVASQIVILGRLNSFKHPRLGLTITKKNIKFAHERNRIKRLIRESFRLNQHNLMLMDFVIIVKKEIINLNNYQVLGILKKLWYYYYL